MIEHFLAQYGYLAIFLLLMLGIVGPLIPDDTILVGSGLAASQGHMHPLAVVLVAYAGSLCGITVSYLLGRTGAIYVLERYGPTKRMVDDHLPKVEQWFEKYGKWTLFFGYFFAGIRHFTALGAGIAKLPFRPFAMYAYPGGLVWVVSFVGLGYTVGSQWERLKPLVERGATGIGVVVVVIALVVWWIRATRGRVQPDPTNRQSGL